MEVWHENRMRRYSLHPPKFRAPLCTAQAAPIVVPQRQFNKRRAPSLSIRRYRAHGPAMWGVSPSRARPGDFGHCPAWPVEGESPGNLQRCLTLFPATYPSPSPSPTCTLRTHLWPSDPRDAICTITSPYSTARIRLASFRETPPTALTTACRPGGWINEPMTAYPTNP